MQAQSAVTGTAYPQVHNHESKDGTNSYQLIAFHKHIAAKASIESLGMDELLKEHEQSNDHPVPDTDTLSDCDADVDSDLDTEEEVEDPSDALVNATVHESSIECAFDNEKKKW